MPFTTLAPVQPKVATTHEQPSEQGVKKEEQAESDEHHAILPPASGAPLDLVVQKKPRRPGSCRTVRLQACRNALTIWRSTTWANTHGSSMFALLPDTALTKLATRARLKTLSDIKDEIPEWALADKYGEEVLKLLEPIDAAWNEANERQKSEKKRINKENRFKQYEQRLLQKRLATAAARAAAVANHPALLVFPSHAPQQYLQPLPYASASNSSNSVSPYPIIANPVATPAVPYPFQFVYQVPYPPAAVQTSSHTQSYVYPSYPNAYPNHLYQWPSQNMS